MYNLRPSVWVGLSLWVVIIVVICVEGELPTAPATDTSPQRFEQIRHGMTLEEVQAILGPGENVQRPKPVGPTFTRITGDLDYHARVQKENAGNCEMRWENDHAVIEIHFQGPHGDVRVSSLGRREFSSEEILCGRLQQAGVVLVALFASGLLIYGLLTPKPVAA